MRLALRRGSDAISPTAHYTGHVWVRNGLSHPELATWEGRVMFDALSPAMAASRALGRGTLEGMLLARHRIIDDILARAIEDGSIGQVVEPACGMAPRGWRFTERFEDLVYVEADLPEMARRKRRALARMGSLSERHRVVDVDVSLDGGPTSIDGITQALDRDRGLAIVTEGLLTYYPDAEVRAMWRRFAAAASRFPAGLYLADLRLGGPSVRLQERAFVVFLSGFVRGAVHAHFAGLDEAIAALEAAGFASARLHRGGEHPAGEVDDPMSATIHIVEALV